MLLHARSGYGVALVIAAVFLFAAVGKAWNPIPAATLLAYLFGTSSPAVIVPALTFLVAWECLLAVLLLMRARSKWSLVAVALTLVAFSLVLLRLRGLPDAPSCGCFGLLRQEYAGASAATLGILRNVLLLAAIGFIALARRDPSPSAVEA